MANLDIISLPSNYCPLGWLCTVVRSKLLGSSRPPSLSFGAGWPERAAKTMGRSHPFIH